MMFGLSTCDLFRLPNCKIVVTGISSTDFSVLLPSPTKVAWIQYSPGLESRTASMWQYLPPSLPPVHLRKMDGDS